MRISRDRTSLRWPTAGVRAKPAGAIRRGLGYVALAVCVAAPLRIVTATASHPLREVPARRGGLPGWLRGPLSGAGFTLRPSQFAVLVLVMTGGYLVAVLCSPSLRARWVIGAIVAVHLIFLLGPPLTSSDFFGYLDWARAGALYGLDPYATASGTVVSDPVYGFLTWHRGVSPYGPLFTLGTYALVPLGLPASVWALKLALTASSLGGVALVWCCARALGRPPVPTALFLGLNPAVLVYTVGGFHNDSLQTLLVLGAVLLVVTGRERAGPAMGVLGVGVKVAAALVLPFLVAGSHDRRRALVAALLTGSAVLAVALAFFGRHAFGFLVALRAEQRQNSGSSVVAQLGDWLGWVGAPPPVRLAASLVGIVAILVLVVRAWRGADWIECAGWAVLVAMTTSAYLLPWYVIWLVPLAALGRSRALAAATAAMTVFVILVRAAPELRSLPANRTAAVFLAAGIAAPLGGGGAAPAPRTSKAFLQPAAAHAFERAWEAEHRMTSGVERRVVAGAHGRCRPGAPASADQPVQRWACEIAYRLDDGTRGRVSYRLAVDPRGCFQAASDAFSPTAFERVLHRAAPNPLARLRSCP